MPEITLREITRQTVRAVCRLAVKPEQALFVAPNSQSIAEAYFAPKAWFRAVYADEELVGFVMLAVDQPRAEYFLWRLMIDARHQGRGYGRKVIELLFQQMQKWPAATTLYASYQKGRHGPEDFYRKLGFQATGQVEDGEHMIKIDLPPATSSSEPAGEQGQS